MTAVQLDLTEDQTLTILRSFLLSILASGTEIVQAQQNRVPEPIGPDFVVMNSIMRERLETDIVGYADAVFTGSIASNVMTITAVRYGSIALGRAVFGIDVADGTVVTGFGTGSGGQGTYIVSPSQIITSEILSVGVRTFMAPTKYTVQLDIHGPLSSDNTQIIKTLFRSQFSGEFFDNSGFPITPLFESDPRQIPFLNAEQQYENRWTMDLALQYNPSITTPQQYADQVLIRSYPNV